jgi:hypothetical protein
MVEIIRSNGWLETKNFTVYGAHAHPRAKEDGCAVRLESRTML